MIIDESSFSLGNYLLLIKYRLIDIEIVFT